jgi:hypothetical protein
MNGDKLMGYVNNFLASAAKVSTTSLHTRQKCKGKLLPMTTIVLPSNHARQQLQPHIAQSIKGLWQVVARMDRKKLLSHQIRPMRSPVGMSNRAGYHV